MLAKGEIDAEANSEDEDVQEPAPAPASAPEPEPEPAFGEGALQPRCVKLQNLTFVAARYR